MAIHGHGGRERLLHGPLEPGGKPVGVPALCRRYRCLRCGCVMLVVPRGVAPWRRYTLCTIALALAGFGEGESTTSLRARLSLEQTFETGWPSLRRWIRAIAEGKLFRWVRGVSELSGRALAQRVAAVAAEASGSAERSAPLEARVWSGVMASSSS